MSAGILTPAERDILERLLLGLSQSQISTIRNCGVSTLQRHIDRIKLKAGVRTLVQLGAWAERHGVREAGSN